MLILGTMQLTRTQSEGQFYCPTCRRERDYRRRASRPFLTIYFIPLIPLGGMSEFVQCRGCRGTFEPVVLSVPRAQALQQSAEQFKDEVLKAMLLVVIADGTISEAEIRGLQRLSHRLFERPVDRDTLGRFCSSHRQTGITVINYLRGVAPRWSHQQRVIALQAMFLAATLEGNPSDPQLAALRAQLKVLELTEREFQDAIERALVLDES